MDKQLKDINEIIDVCKDLVIRLKELGKVETGDDLYEKYKALIESFCSKYDIENNHLELVRSTFCSIKKYYWKGNYTISFLEANIILSTIIYLKTLLLPDLFEKIFISHAEKDKGQVDAFIELLFAIGIPRPLQKSEKIIFCSSHPASYIENGQLIDEQILKQFKCEKNVLFILWYTDNYFNSQACLNEMGAIWAMGKTYQEILIPGFDRKKIGGLLPKTKLSFYANDKYRLNTFKEQIEKYFYLQPVDSNAWELARDKFIKTIEK